MAFRLIDPAIVASVIRVDGSLVAAGEAIATLEGPACGLLTAERVALNFLCHMSGIATATAEVVEAVRGTKARVIDIRKTLPGLRAVQKYAIRAGGGANHRFGLDDGVLIKDNHIAVAGGIRAAIERARAAAGHMVKVEIEVDTLEQLAEALRRRWEITESFGVTRVPLHVIPGEGPVSTSCSAGLGKGVDAGPSPGMTA
jgi:nicotinate-nucleotide pyrophosphorylase (carboxylating)